MDLVQIDEALRVATGESIKDVKNDAKEILKGIDSSDLQGSAMSKIISEAKSRGLNPSTMKLGDIMAIISSIVISASCKALLASALEAPAVFRIPGTAIACILREGAQWSSTIGPCTGTASRGYYLSARFIAFHPVNQSSERIEPIQRRTAGAMGHARYGKYPHECVLALILISIDLLPPVCRIVNRKYGVRDAMGYDHLSAPALKRLKVGFARTPDFRICLPESLTM